MYRVNCYSSSDGYLVEIMEKGFNVKHVINIVNRDNIQQQLDNIELAELLYPTTANCSTITIDYDIDIMLRSETQQTNKNIF